MEWVKNMKMSRGTFLYMIFYLCIHFIAFHFLNPLKFVGVYQMEISTGKKHFTLGKNRKSGFAHPPEKHSSYATGPMFTDFLLVLPCMSFIICEYLRDKWIIIL